ncbi:hypothetical protein [Arsenicicoccus bolidensis]|uniref:hypothetical protein n=1 Tax=Arsenicicoccus bolidensis TaxID=229480 RepID=UPI0012ECA2BB|nr:hypothetical protein [Arsenicicoccus bolidensis]
MAHEYLLHEVSRYARVVEVVTNPDGTVQIAAQWQLDALEMRDHVKRALDRAQMESGTTATPASVMGHDEAVADLTALHDAMRRAAGE